jgi:tetratricopeptide (TPR) repeat protein
MNEAKKTSAETVFEVRALIDRRRYDLARTRLAGALKEHPDDADLLCLSALVEYFSDDKPAARASIRAALNADPQHAGARNLFAHILEDDKQYSEAERVLIALLRDYPEDASYYATYAQLMLRTLNIDKARRLAREGLRFEPEHAGCLYVVALADVIDGVGAGENASLATLVREHPEAVNTAVTLIVALQDRGDTRGALRIAQELLRSQPDNKQYVQLVRELKSVGHWSLLPLYPMVKWGWGGAIAVWFIGIVGLRLLSQVASPAVVMTAAAVWLLYVIYSWVWPPLLRRLLRA